MTKASRDTQARRKGKKGKRKREKERERESERKREKRKRRKEKEVDRCSQLRASVQGHTRERGVPECYIQERPRRKRGRVL